ncbi:F-box/kelch-repeat protein At3g23880-like [Silene latifolia]|uniref:F-box/kelch-repeat protein At3g23880-like n=1 Tax=Silene latifolia TaxID=37657 RepID=UPI003D76EC8B
MAATIDLDDLTSVLGFGYDSKKNDHRVVKISFCRFDDEVNPLVEVYSVWGRIWRNIPTDYLVDNSISRVYSSHCFINGVIHLLASSSAGVWVLLFDVVEETFQKIELPDIFSSTCLIGVGLLEYKTKLSVSHCYNERNTAKCQIWVKEEECWCLILNDALYDRIHIGPLDYLGRNGESFGFARVSNRKLLLCDLMTTKMKRPVKLCIHRYVTMDLPELGLRQDASTKFAAFTESLVLLDQNTDVYTDEQLQRYT